MLEGSIHNSNTFGSGNKDSFDKNNKNKNNFNSSGNRIINKKYNKSNNEVIIKQKAMIFTDISSFLNKKISIILFGGKIITGILRENDEQSNCIVLGEDQKNYFILGKSISLINESMYKIPQ